jgi:hypothetical protein
VRPQDLADGLVGEPSPGSSRVSHDPFDTNPRRRVGAWSLSKPGNVMNDSEIVAIRGFSWMASGNGRRLRPQSSISGRRPERGMCGQRSRPRNPRRIVRPFQDGSRLG